MSDYKNGGRVGRTKRLLETLTDEDKDKDPKETLNLTLDLSGIPLTLKNRQPLQWCSPSPFIAQGGKTVYKKVRQISPFIQWGYFP